MKLGKTIFVKPFYDKVFFLPQTDYAMKIILMKLCEFFTRQSVFQKLTKDKNKKLLPGLVGFLPFV